MPRQEYRDLKRRVKPAGILLSSGKYGKIWDQVDSGLKCHFDSILDLGDRKYDGYKELAKSDIKRKALQLRDMAVKCRHERQNEAGWRAAIEGKIFERFDAEVACKQCSKRSPITSRAALQNKMKGCTCVFSSQRENGEATRLDPGWSNLFSSRMDTACCAPSKSADEPVTKPDRMHGLARTNRFDACLQSPYRNSDRFEHRLTPVEDNIETTLQCDDGGSPPLFPFLFLEAKSECGTSSFEAMEVKACFPIKYALELQQRLFEAPGNTMRLPCDPLVWFLAYNGEDWRVYAAHIESVDGSPKYTIKYLWGGSVTGKDEMLQLLLIIDYILDWARDTFRPSILGQLESLCCAESSNRAIVDLDMTVLSLTPETEEEDDDQSEETVSTPQKFLANHPGNEARSDSLDPFQHLSTTHGLVKDARCIDFRVKGLRITSENLASFLESFKTPQQARSFARQVITLLKRNHQCVALEKESVLDAVEELWTGVSGVQAGKSLATSRFFVQLHVSFYISSSWAIVRELTYLAVEDSAFESLIGHTGDTPVEKQRVARAQIPLTTCHKMELKEALTDMRRRSVREGLLGALCRRSYRLIFEGSRTVISIDELNKPTEKQHACVVFEQDKDPNSGGVTMQRIVYKILNNHRIGQREPSDPYLRNASHIDADNDARPLWDGWVPGDRLYGGDAELDKLLVYSHVPSARPLSDSARRTLCVYVMDGQQRGLTRSEIAAKLQCAAFERGAVYGTARRTRPPGSTGGEKYGRDNRSGCVVSFQGEEEERFCGEVGAWIGELGRGAEGR